MIAADEVKNVHMSKKKMKVITESNNTIRVKNIRAEKIDQKSTFFSFFLNHLNCIFDSKVKN